MKPLVNGLPAPDESWEELAEHSITHDDLFECRIHRVCVVAPYPGWLLDSVGNRPIINVLSLSKGE